MVDKKFYLTSVVVFATIISAVHSYKILGVIPFSAKSHFIVGNALMKGLAEKGHEVTMISPFPQKDPIKNYRDIESSTILKKMKEKLGNVLNLRDKNIVQLLLKMYDMGVLISNSTLGESSVQELMKSGEKFDVVICEVFLTEALYGLAEHFNASLIGLSTFGAIKWNTDLVGSPSPPSYVPHLFLPLTNQMSLSERILNLAVATFEEIYFSNFYLPRQREVFNNFFPNSKLGLDTISKNTALVLLNCHVSMGFPRPYMPNMIEVGGMHINHKRKPLPADMQKFLDEAKDGAVYFSMGSNLNSSVLPLEKRNAILQTFKSLKQRVLWKFEETNLPGKSDNVYINDWFPQDDILAHPNVKLFITHGGLLSTTESIYHEKPFVGIPMFADQFLNMARAETGGYGIMVNYNQLSKDTFSAAINKVLGDPEYTTKVKMISQRYRDQPLSPLELATYWVEYVARHKGAPHLHSAGQELSFIQYHNLDAILILYGGILLVLLIVLKILFSLIVRFLGLRKQPKKPQKVKKN